MPMIFAALTLACLLMFCGCQTPQVQTARRIIKAACWVERQLPEDMGGMVGATPEGMPEGRPADRIVLTATVTDV